MKFSIVTPLYNKAEFINESINSVLVQEERDFELIICDDASTDDSFSKVQSYQDDRIVLLRNEINLGVSATRNRCLDVAVGEVVVFLDGDDKMDRNYLMTLWFLYCNKSVEAVATSYSLTSTSKVIHPGNSGKLNSFDIALLSGFSLKRRSDLRFNESIKYGEDILFFLEVKKRVNIFYLQTPLIIYRDESHAQREFENYKRNPKEVFLTAIDNGRLDISYLSYVKALLPWYTFGQKFWRYDFGRYYDRLILRVLSLLYRCLR